jgi:hypothetical protein
MKKITIAIMAIAFATGCTKKADYICDVSILINDSTAIETKGVKVFLKSGQTIEAWKKENTARMPVINNNGTYDYSATLDMPPTCIEY